MKNIAVTVILTVKEYEQLRKESALIASGTVASVLRTKANLSEEPYGRNRENGTEENYLSWKAKNNE